MFIFINRILKWVNIGAIKAMIVDRVGDLGLLLGICVYFGVQ